MRRPVSAPRCVIYLRRRPLFGMVAFGYVLGAFRPLATVLLLVYSSNLLILPQCQKLKIVQ